MSRLIIPGQSQAPQAGDVQMGAEQGMVVLRQCLVISQVFPPDEAERFAQGLLKTVELARQQVVAMQTVVDGNGIGQAGDIR